MRRLLKSHKIPSKMAWIEMHGRPVKSLHCCTKVFSNRIPLTVLQRPKELPACIQLGLSSLFTVTSCYIVGNIQRLVLSRTPRKPVLGLVSVSQVHQDNSIGSVESLSPMWTIENRLDLPRHPRPWDSAHPLFHLFSCCARDPASMIFLNHDGYLAFVLMAALVFLKIKVSLSVYFMLILNNYAIFFAFQADKVWSFLRQSRTLS